VIAEEKGFFKSEGLNVIVVIMQNQVVVNGVVTRNVDYGGTFSNFVGAAISGLPVRIVMSAMDGSDHYLVTSANVKRVEDLKGKTFGISSFGGTPHSEAIAILRKYNLNPEKDVTFLQGNCDLCHREGKGARPVVVNRTRRPHVPPARPGPPGLAQCLR